MIVIGIAGGTGSGKTTVVKKIVESLPEGSIAVIPQDSYYKDQSNIPIEDRRKTNFDHPNAFDWPLFESQIQDLCNGKAIEQPQYSYVLNNRLKETVHIEPQSVIIIEGIMALYSKKLRDLMDVKIFIDTPSDERLLRVFVRDIAVRDQKFEVLVEKYRNVLKPMHEEFIEPTKQYADIIIPNGGDNTKGINLIGQFISSISQFSTKNIDD